MYKDIAKLALLLCGFRYREAMRLTYKHFVKAKEFELQIIYSNPIGYVVEIPKVYREVFSGVSTSKGGMPMSVSKDVIAPSSGVSTSKGDMPMSVSKDVNVAINVSVRVE